jgi:hypothetical protein
MTAFRVIVNLGTLRLAAGFLIALPGCPMTLGPWMQALPGLRQKETQQVIA